MASRVASRVASEAGIRRSRFLITYWEHGSHRAYNYLTRISRPCPALVTAILDITGRWTTRASVRRALSREDGELVNETIDELIQDGVLDSADRPPHPEEAALLAWEGWNPAAGFFHAATRSPAPPDAEASRQRRNRLLVGGEFPPALKQYSDQPRVDLPACSGAGPLAEVLWNRRTWREFGNGYLTLAEIATLLGLTFGVERWLEAGEGRWVALKTSPSGGARHSIEAYLIAFDIDGIENGTYHYCPDSHTLSLLRSPTGRELMAAFVPNQPGFQHPAGFIVMTSVFERVQWKYQNPHAYRVVLLDAGHLSQTFALVATALGLAPFCSAALDAPAIERHLGIDGISEAVVLAAGVGPKPPGKEWAPRHDRAAPPRTAPPAWAKRLPARPFP